MSPIIFCWIGGVAVLLLITDADIGDVPKMEAPVEPPGFDAGPIRTKDRIN